MADIFHSFPINAPANRVFEAISTPPGLDSWWTNTCDATPAQNAEYKLGFGPGYDWRAVATKWLPDSALELKLVDADDDWRGTSIRFGLSENNGVTEVAFEHFGWPEANEHYRISTFCWAMYLRLLKRYVEFSEVVPYEERLNV